jgi:hypothetical protein
MSKKVKSKAKEVDSIYTAIASDIVYTNLNKLIQLKNRLNDIFKRNIVDYYIYRNILIAHLICKIYPQMKLKVNYKSISMEEQKSNELGEINKCTNMVIKTSSPIKKFESETISELEWACTSNVLDGLIIGIFQKDVLKILIIIDEEDSITAIKKSISDNPTVDGKKKKYSLKMSNLYDLVNAKIINFISVEQKYLNTTLTSNTIDDIISGNNNAHANTDEEKTTKKAE